MPLPHGSLSLQSASAAGISTSQKAAMLVRLPAEAYAALANHAEIEVVSDGPSPGITIGGTFYPLKHQRETHPHELLLQSRAPGRPNATLKAYAPIVHKMVPDDAAARPKKPAAAYARAAAAAEPPRASTGMLETLPTTLQPGTAAPAKAAAKKAAPAKKKAAPSATGPRASSGGAGAALNLSTARNEGARGGTPGSSARASPMPPPPAPGTGSRRREPTSAEKGEIVLAKMPTEERDALQARMVHEVAKGARDPRTRESLRKSFAELDFDAFKSLLAEVAEPTPPIRAEPTADTLYSLKLRCWRQVRPFAPSSGLTTKEANMIAEFADGALDRMGVSARDPSREHVRPRGPHAQGRLPSPPQPLSGGVALSNKSTLPPKPPGLPNKPAATALPPIDKAPAAQRQRASPLPVPPGTSAAAAKRASPMPPPANVRRESPAARPSAAAVPPRRRAADTGSEREEGEMDEDEPAPARRQIAPLPRKEKGAVTKEHEQAPARTRVKQESHSPPPPTPTTAQAKKGVKRTRGDESDAGTAPRRSTAGPSRARERDEDDAPARPKKMQKRSASPPPAAAKKKAPARAGEREETPGSAASGGRRKRGREVDYSSDSSDGALAAPKRKREDGEGAKARQSMPAAAGAGATGKGVVVKKEERAAKLPPPPAADAKKAALGKDRAREKEREKEKEKERDAAAAKRRRAGSELEDGEEPGSGSSASDTDAPHPDALGPMPGTEDALRARLRLAYGHYYAAHAACEDERDAVRALLGDTRADAPADVHDARWVDRVFRREQAWGREVKLIRQAAEEMHAAQA